MQFIGLCRYSIERKVDRGNSPILFQIGVVSFSLPIINSQDTHENAPNLAYLFTEIVRINGMNLRIYVMVDLSGTNGNIRCQSPRRTMNAPLLSKRQMWHSKLVNYFLPII